MVPPFWAIPIGLVFLIINTVTFIERPQLTARWRKWYFIGGVCGLLSGAEWLMWNAALCGWGREEKPLLELLTKMLRKEGLGSLLATLFVVGGVWFFVKAIRGRPMSTSQNESTRA